MTNEQRRPVRLSKRADELIRANARNEFSAENATQRPDGSWDVWMSHETIERVQSIALPGETVSDTVERMLSTMSGKN